MTIHIKTQISGDEEFGQILDDIENAVGAFVDLFSDIFKSPEKYEKREHCCTKENCCKKKEEDLDLDSLPIPETVKV